MAYDYVGHQVRAGTQNGQPVFSATYDANGNMIGATRGGKPTGYGYDALGRLTSASTPSGPVFLTYDYAGRRVTKAAGGTLTSYVSPQYETRTFAGGA